MLPSEFMRRMEALLGDELCEFMSALDQPARRAFRLNPIKYKDGTADAALMTDADKLTPIPYAPLGYLPDESLCAGLGNHPAHHAGIIYIQDAGAMAPINAIDIKEDFRIADLCASPGGKSTQAAARLGEGGFILSNEYVPKRAKTLVGNFERMGIRCGVVTSLDTGEIAKLYDSFFDLVIVDAPCSGEGMFRKDNPAREEWSEDNVKLCALRQKEILDNAAELVKDGGHLLYSTCTYSIEENEEQIADFIKRHPDYSIVPIEWANEEGISPGVVPIGSELADLCNTARFYPHKTPGEGQFAALVQRCCPGKTPKINYRDEAKPLSRDEAAVVDSFFRENLKTRPGGRVVKHGENIVICSHDLPLPRRSVFSAGVLLGEIRGRLLFPSHQFFSAYGGDFIRTEELSGQRLERYLCGEEIEAVELQNEVGYCALTYLGAPIGGGKVTSGRIKNHYPKGLRKNG